MCGVWLVLVCGFACLFVWDLQSGHTPSAHGAIYDSNEKEHEICNKYKPLWRIRPSLPSFFALLQPPPTLNARLSFLVPSPILTRAILTFTHHGQLKQPATSTISIKSKSLALAGSRPLILAMVQPAPHPLPEPERGEASRPPSRGAMECLKTRHCQTLHRNIWPKRKINDEKGLDHPHEDAL